MSATISTVEPQRVTAGDTIQWTKEIPDYPPGQYTLKYVFRGPSNFEVTAATSGTLHLVTITAAVSAGFVPGDYFWQSYAESGSTRFTQARGRLTILENLAAVTDEGFDGRSQARKILEAIRAVILKKASRVQEEYEVDGVRVKDIPPEQLIVLEIRYSSIVQSEESQESIDIGRPSRRKINFRFTRP